jgi:hypothetical protein
MGTEDETADGKPADEDTRPLQVLSEVGTFASRLLAPDLAWFNASPDRVTELERMLLPKKGGTSLRLADHLVVQYSREHTVWVRKAGNVPAQLWLDYRQRLESTGKRYFDVFKRKNAIRIKIFGKEVESTVGQITFLAWYFYRELHVYMAENEDAIRRHMQRGEKRAASDKRKTARAATEEGGGPKKKKCRAPSRADAVKPHAWSFTGSFILKY